MPKFERINRKPIFPSTMTFRHLAIPIICTSAGIFLLSCRPGGNGWTDSERAVINDGGTVMRVLTIDDKDDSLFLRTPSKELTPKQILSEDYRSLAARMVITVTSPEQDGVGIAGPQVGIGRRVVAVQRFDKEGEPFEVYPNIRITARRGEPEPGPEGCLSVPGRRGDVLRWQDIDIAYSSPATGRDTSETVTGFTAVIFQHETDHLDGVLYIDKLAQ